MLAVAIAVRLRAKQLPEAIALRGKISGARIFDVASASRTQRSHVREFVSEVQTTNSSVSIFTFPGAKGSPTLPLWRVRRVLPPGRHTTGSRFRRGMRRSVRG